jgi:hypothetical protein
MFQRLQQQFLDLIALHGAAPLEKEVAVFIATDMPRCEFSKMSVSSSKLGRIFRLYASS